jgi:serine/threonine-protein kinase RsbW
MNDNTRVIELRIPSELGYEKMAARLAETVAQHVGFAPERVEDLRTAVSEACLNAIEHGNQMVAGTRVRVRISAYSDRLDIEVHDEGRGSPPPDHFPEPDIKRKIKGEEGVRQMGLYVIRRLVDESGFVKTDPSTGNQFRIVMRLKRSTGAKEETRGL